jgi:hypothetical protein
MSLLTVAESAEYLHVSTSWVRRHFSELPVSRHGRLIRIDSEKLTLSTQTGNPLEPRKAIMPNRYQIGSVKPRGKTWQGIYRVDVQTPTGIERRQKRVVLGFIKDMRINQARVELSKIIAGDAPIVEPLKMDFNSLVERWAA